MVKCSFTIYVFVGSSPVGVNQKQVLKLFETTLLNSKNSDFIKNGLHHGSITLNLA